MFRATQFAQQRFTLTLVQPEQRIDVGAAIAIFGEEASHRFCSMIRAHNKAFGHTGDAVLGFHAFTGFFIAAYEIAELDTGVA